MAVVIEGYEVGFGRSNGTTQLFEATGGAATVHGSVTCRGSHRWSAHGVVSARPETKLAADAATKFSAVKRLLMEVDRVRRETAHEQGGGGS